MQVRSSLLSGFEKVGLWDIVEFGDKIKHIGNLCNIGFATTSIILFCCLYFVNSPQDDLVLKSLESEGFFN